MTIDIKNIHNQVAAFLSNAVSREYKIKNCDFGSKSLVYFNSAVCIAINCELTLSRDDTEIVVLCPLIIKP